MAIGILIIMKRIDGKRRGMNEGRQKR